MIGDSNNGKEPISYLEISPDSKWIVVYNKYKQILLQICLQKKTVVKDFSTPLREINYYNVDCLAFIKDGDNTKNHEFALLIGSAAGIFTKLSLVTYAIDQEFFIINGKTITKILSDYKNNQLF